MPSSQTPAPTGVPPETTLREREAQAVLWVRAVEEADPEGTWLAQSERRQATEGARESTGFEDFLVQRARTLLEVLDRANPGLARLRHAAGLRLATAWIVGPALLLGVASNLLGSEQRINVVANPLAGLLLWNFVVYLVILGAALRGRATRERTSWQPGLSLASRLLTWPARASSRGDAPATEHVAQARAVTSYLENWNRCAFPLLVARLRHALHLGAAAMVLGALGGMYARGLLLEYRVTWESTFLDAGQVETWLSFLLGPAAWLTGIQLPDAETLRAIQKPASGQAATWIHLYAASTALFVIVPRILLATAAARRARREAEALIVDTRPRYYRRLLAGARGAGVQALVVPYSYTPSVPRLDRLKAILHDVLGARAVIRVGPVMEYGAQHEDATEGQAHDDSWRIMLFNLAQTPESEVHGRLLEDLRREARAGGSCLVLVDAAAWREHAGGTGTFEQRLSERRRTWERVVRAAELEAVHVDLDERPDDDLPEHIEQAAWPAPEGLLEQ